MDRDKLKALHDHVSRGRYLEVQSLLNEGISPDSKNSVGNTPLMMAARHSHKDIVDLLINSGADIHCLGSQGWTALHNAALGGSIEIVQCLVSIGVALDVKNSISETPLMTAVRLSRNEVVKLLIKSGADVHIRDDRGWTLLHYVSFWSDIEMVQVFLNEGIYINVQTSNGETPLHLAIQYGKIRIADYLLKVGADVNLESSGGESPFTSLIWNKRCDVEIIKLCIEKGAFLKSMDCCVMLEDPLKKKILEDAKFCSQAIVNKFNNRDLPLFYNGLVPSQKIPHIDKMKIKDGSGTALLIENAVNREIQAKGFYDLSKMVPPVLSILCVELSNKSLKLGLNQTEKPTTILKGYEKIKM